jgi:nicotinic acid mononucleotide adenylyltransferase
VKDLFESGWEGVISEVGLGVPLQAEILSQSGASNFLLLGMTPYNQAFQPKTNERSVSEKMVVKMAQAIFNHAKASGFPRQDKRLFAAAVTGTHTLTTKGGQTHAWMCVMTQKDIFIVHFYMRSRMSRKTAIKSAKYQTLNILRAALLNELPGRISDYYGVKIDVIRWPNTSMTDKINICLSDHNPIYFDAQGHMQRATDIIRGATAIYRGSFNPVTQSHLEIGQDALFELSKTNYRKPAATTEDITHRVNMLNLAGKGVLVTQGMELFVNIREMLYTRFKFKKELPYVMGMDTFNAVVEHGLQDAHALIILQAMNFIVNERGNTPIHPKSSGMKIEYVQRDNDYSSTKARAGDHSGLPPGVADYIKENKLY